MRNMIYIFISIFLFVGCASGTNPYFTNKNVGTALGGGAGAVGGSILAKSVKAKGLKQAGIIGGLTLLGALLGGTAGARIDLADQNRQVKLIEDVLANNREGETSSTQYTKTYRDSNGQQQTAVITQRATPGRYYQSTGIVPVPNNNRFPGGQGRNYYGPDCEVGCFAPPLTAVYPQQSICRDIEISISISVDNAPPDTRQWYRMCRTEQGWRQVPRG